LHCDPLRTNLIAGAPLGLLAIQLETRRRNRANGFVIERDDEGFLFEVAQSFGNCPKYIQARSPRFVADPASFAGQRALCAESRVLSAAGIAQIEGADTFFIASATRNDQGGYDRVHGVDASHRGGKPGFVRVTLEHGASVLTWPDFAGNNLFNTLGNLARDPRAGLLFVDFESGDLTALTGHAEVLWTGAEVGAFRGAQRLVRFSVERGYAAPGAVPLRASPPVPARQLAATGSWEEVRSRE
jgi:predicted pyridoxine 5'-phosphate oxidase superfamily flavin-nucleotide-binding protein